MWDIAFAMRVVLDDVMPVSFSQGVYHHGKRHRFVVTAKDDSAEAAKAAMLELSEQVRKFKESLAALVARRSFRKSKGGLAPS